MGQAAGWAPDTRGGASLVSTLAPAGVEILAEALQARFGQRLRRAEPLAAHTTLRVGGPADLWLTVTSLDELVTAVGLAWQLDFPVLVLGSGANLLVSDRGVRGLVVQNRCQRTTFPGEELKSEVEQLPYVLVESGTILPSLANRLAQHGLSGLEWAVGVPGTVGGAVVNNAGAHGSSIADCLVKAELYQRTSQRRQWKPVTWFEYGYRSSRLKRRAGGQTSERLEQYVVLQAKLELRRRPPGEIERHMAAYTERRRATQPSGPSVGSMFKNPPGDFAGRLIEAAGLKGTQVGGAQISLVHANFFVNLGHATAADFAHLVELTRQAVRADFGIELELEIEQIGDWQSE